MAKNLIYQLFSASWPGGFKEMTRRIKYLEEIGVDTIWLSPFYRSPRADMGYDVEDYTSVDPKIGSMREFNRFLKLAHRAGIKVIIDLVLNHTSVKHKWFIEHPEYYIWREDDKNTEGWKNLLDEQSPCWKKSKLHGKYYLHVFHEGQADLNWFPRGPKRGLNKALIQEFRSIVDFWVKKGVDGFHLDPQAINKDYCACNFSITTTTDADYLPMAKKVINDIFKEHDDLFLLMGCYDLNGQVADYYWKNTPIDKVIDMYIKDAAVMGKIAYIKAAKAAYYNCPEGYTHVMESHDTPRFPSRTDTPVKESLRLLFGYDRDKKIINKIDTIVVYQGQELGLKNPTEKELSDELLLELDAQAATKHARGIKLEALRHTSRANARTPIPAEEYDKQKDELGSNLTVFECLVNQWRNN